MIHTELSWNLHDAVIIDCNFFDNRLIINVQLYEIFYPAKPSVRLTFSGIYNVEKLMKFHEAINSDEAQPGWNGTRINAFHYDTKKISKDGDLYLFFDADYADPITIHCRQFSMEENNS